MQKYIQPSKYGLSDQAPDTGEDRKIFIDTRNGFNIKKGDIISSEYVVLHYDSNGNETGRRLRFYITGRNSERVNSNGQRISRWELNEDGSYKLDSEGEKIWNTNWDSGINEYDYVLSLLDTNPETSDNIIVYYAEQFLAKHLQTNGIDYLYDVMNQEFLVNLKDVLVNG